MSRVSCVITEDDGSTKHEYTPTNVKFSAEGSKKPDTLSAHFIISNKVKENYEIAYIQDIISVEYLDAIWNFQLSALDDRGYDLDGESSGSVNIPESRFVDVTSERFKGNYALDFNAVSQDIKIPNAKAITRFDFSKQFDIYIFFTPVDSSETRPIIWSFSDGIGGEGLEIGIDEVTSTTWRTFVRLHGSGNPTIAGTTIKSFDGVPNLIRVFRGGDNIVHVELNGFPEGSQLFTDSLQPSGSPDVILGCDASGGNDYIGQIHQIRSYHGTVLTQSQADAIRQSTPALFTMKFAGFVWDVQDKESYKIVRCDSFSKDLIKSKYELTSSPVTFDLTSESFQSILQSLVDNSSSSIDFLVKAKDTFASVLTSPPLLGELIQVGSFLDVVSILFLFSDTTFYITPRKLLIVETGAGHPTDHIFDQDSDTTPYDITESEDNNTTLATTVILTSPTLLTEDSPASVSGARSTLRKHISQLDFQTDLSSLAIKIRESLQTIKTKHVIKINTLVNWIRFNQVVTINNTRKDITNDSFTVTQIGFEYPKSFTSIMVNENDIDFFDISSRDASIQQTLLDATDT